MVIHSNRSNIDATAKSVVTSSQKVVNRLEHAGSRHSICKVGEWFQVKKLESEMKRKPISGLKSAGPRGRFPSLERPDL